MRKRMKVFVASIMACAAFFCFACADSSVYYLPYFDGIADDKSYNTELFYRNDLLLNHAADPGCIWVSKEESAEYGGYFYMYPTSVYYNFQVFRSKDLNNWEKLGLAIDFESSEEERFFSENLWAPEVIRNPKDGKYYMYFSGIEDMAKVTGSIGSAEYQLGVAVSDNPAGGFKMCSGTNLYGETLDETKPTIDFNIQHGNPGEEYYTPARTGRDRFYNIDVSPFFDDDGQLYMYFRPTYLYDRGGHNYAHLAVVKMRDMVTPDYTSYTELTYPGYQSMEDYRNGVKFELEDGSALDEAPFMIKHDGIYYLTYATHGYTKRDKYCVAVAVSDNPMGPFIKLSGENGNPSLYIEPYMDQMAGPGHHAFVYRGDDIFVIYHSLMNRATGDSNPRGIAVDRVQFIDGGNLGIKASDYGIETESGTFDALYTNGATWSLQPLMTSVSGYENIAPEADVSATSAREDTVRYLNDGIFANHTYSAHMEMVAEKETEITLEFSSPREIRAIMIYNSFEYIYAFSMIDKIEFTLAEKIDGKDTAIIKNLAFNSDYYSADDMFMRPGGSCLAEFEPIKVTEIKLTISRKLDDTGEGGDEIRVSDIVVLSKKEA
ncbi:MAG: family 43 glycosylhydrolase [Christensenellales bacterium]